MIGKFGESANGKANFAPVQRLEAPQINIRNPFNDLIAIAMKEREMELKEKGLGLGEQELAYRAAKDEADRDLARELAGQKVKDAKDILKMEYDYKNSFVNKAKAEEDLIQKEINKYYGYLENLGDQGMDVSNPYFFTVAREYARDTGNKGIVDFFTNNGAKAAELNNLYLQNRIKKDVVGDTIKGYSGNGKVTTHRAYE
ncbi:hypothetical protein [uncultured Campylobacter sp.]|uniref:hypothetical protein n=1 Tax=uncultured Campylobacter sp. TaxID=218934 RepID=UPI0026282275|nr:hypothetical protein [uncultured Campylobacter sp.]